MAKKLLPVPALPAAKAKKKSVAENSDYWSLNDSIVPEESDPLPKLAVHGLRRAGIRKRIF